MVQPDFFLVRLETFFHHPSHAGYAHRRVQVRRRQWGHVEAALAWRESAFLRQYGAA